MEPEYLDKVYYKDSRKMHELPDNSVNLVVTSPPYFNIKDYSLDGYQNKTLGLKEAGQIGDIADYKRYVTEMLKVWKECQRVLKPNGKLVINSPLMPMVKRKFSTHYNRHIFDINSDIQHSIVSSTNLFLLDVYIWNRTNPSKKLMFGSYPYPRNFYAQNTIEFVTVYVKDGVLNERVSGELKKSSKLSQSEWLEFTKQIWNIPIPGKNDIAYGSHSALMPEEIVSRCIKMFTFKNDVVLDPFAGSGTTLKVALELNRHYVGYEISKSYQYIISSKISPKLL